MPYEEVAVSDATAAGSNEVEVSGHLDASRPATVLHLGLGRSVTVPTELLLSGIAPESAVAGEGSTPRSARDSSAATRVADAGETVVALGAEEMHVDKQTVVTGKVRLHHSVETYTDSATLPLTRTSWDVQRTPVGELVAEKPQVRQEGEMTIYPLVEERIVARREYFLVEEVRVRQVATTTERTASLELKRDVLTLEREAVANAPLESAKN